MRRIYVINTVIGCNALHVIFANIVVFIGWFCDHQGDEFVNTTSGTDKTALTVFAAISTILWAGGKSYALPMKSEFESDD